MKNILLLFVLFLFNGFLLSAQSLDEARELYKIGEFEKALPVFEREYQVKPNDASLNMWYGACLFETSGDLVKAEEYLLFASKKNVHDSFLYLGKLYTKTYRFAEAEKEFTRYAKLKSRDKAALAKLGEERDYLSLMERSVSRTENIQIIDSIVLNKKDFLNAFILSPSSGYLANYNTIFRTDKNIDATVYLNEKETKMYFGKPVGDNKYDLFSREKLIDDFGSEKRLSDNHFGLSGSVNYPFVMTDGVTIYFSAEDENGLGGYDIYITRYNLNNDTYLTPERLNMPFNSSFNDYMMAIDEEKGIGWFATDRFQPANRVCIYTFVPSEQYEMIDNEDDNYLLKRAKISSIRNSWQPGADYSQLIALAKKKTERKKEIAKDFEFVVNDSYTYYKLDDFRNAVARGYYTQVNDLKKELTNTEKKLEPMRDGYHNNRNAATANEIINLEKRLAQLYTDIKDLEIKARNQEINSLNR